MESTATEGISEENTDKEEATYIEIEIPDNLFQFLSRENYNVQNICRICLSTDSEVLYPLISDKDNSFLADLFTTLTTLRPTVEDGLPSSICELCQTAILQFYEFKIRSEKSDYVLRSILKGEFIPKDEPTERPDKIESYDQSKVKNEPESGEEVQYLESFSDDGNDTEDKLFIVQNNRKRKRKTLQVKKRGTKYSQNKKGIKLEKKPAQQKSYTCILCSKVFPNAGAYKIHKKNNHGAKEEKRPYPCGQCKESFDSEHDLNVHVMLHSKSMTWRCDQCKKEFNTKNHLRRHIQRHMEFKRHSCETCGKTFTELYALRRHVRVHTGEQLEKKFACHLCDKRYSESGLLAKHVRRHDDVRECECTECGKRFATRRLLDSHARVHSDLKAYACRYCDKRFRHESTRNTHHRTHTGEKPYVCSFCGKNFIQNSNLTLHMRVHTGERPYECSICKRKFTSGSTLKSHERIHTGERPYSCHICGKRFARMNLSVHMRQHTGERPFACTACPKKFVNASRLRDHCRIHTGEKPFACSYCTFTFSTKSHLVKHMKSHNPPKKKTAKQGVVMQQVLANPSRNIVYENVNNERVTVENAEVTSDENVLENNIILDIEQEVPMEVTGELSLQNENEAKTDLFIVENSQNNYQIGNNNICINENINGDLVTVNEGGMSISASALEGTTVKLYQLDQSLLQIHSSSGQVTISKITSKMTANF